MTLGSETVALLLQTTHALTYQTAAPQTTVVSADDRKSALRQLMATVEAAAKLAEVAHVEALAHQMAPPDSDKERIMTDTEVPSRGTADGRGAAALRAEVVRLGNDVKKTTQEMEVLRAELRTARSEKIKAESQVQWLKAAVESNRDSDTERVLEDTARIREELNEVRSALGIPVLFS